MQLHFSREEDKAFFLGLIEVSAAPDSNQHCASDEGGLTSFQMSPDR